MDVPIQSGFPPIRFAHGPDVGSRALLASGLGVATGGATADSEQSVDGAAIDATTIGFGATADGATGSHAHVIDSVAIGAMVSDAADRAMRIDLIQA